MTLSRHNCQVTHILLFTKMSAKLVVHKIDENINFKSLHITFEDGDNATISQYGEWSEGKTIHKKRDMQKSRLVVKIVSGNEHNDFNLDSCAKSIEEFDAYYGNANQRNLFSSNQQNMTNMVPEKGPTRGERDQYSYIMYKNYEERIRGNNYPIINQTSTNPQDSHRPSTINSTNLSPLEYSLERVKKNNARIMENIHMLNRTLNYTKNKEILDNCIGRVKNLRYPCNTCGKCFVYKTGLKRHYSMIHAMSEMQPRWQVVWTCVECFQVWPRQDLALEHATQCCKADNADCVREIKTSSLLQCEFCEKVFTSIPRLLRHSKIHTTASNYECNACNISFTSYKIAEQHWLLCPWLKMCYTFALPKMLLCNACDRKFRNYEQLYNHRYKVGHFMTKTHSHKGSTKSLGVLVYQCEMCGQWFPSIQTLQMHRKQNHSGIDNYETHWQYQCGPEQNFKDYDDTLSDNFNS